MKKEVLNRIEVPADCRAVYVKGGEKAVVGFERFEDAEAYAEANGLDVVLLHSRAGWDVWEDQGRIFEAPELTAEDYGGHTIYRKEDAEDLKAGMADFVDGFEGKELEDVTDYYQRLVAAVEGLKDDEIVVEGEGGFDVEQVTSMAWENDSHYYRVGVL